MPLYSTLFKKDPFLNSFLLDDRIKIKRGAIGEHVRRMQTALYALDEIDVNASELNQKRLGVSTETALIDYMRDRSLLNYASRLPNDEIVTKDLLLVLDRDMSLEEIQPHNADEASHFAWTTRRSHGRHG